MAGSVQRFGWWLALPALGVAAASLALTTQGGAAPSAIAPASDFIDSIGVNAHILFSPPAFAAWGDLNRVEAALSYLGVGHVRDGARAMSPADVARFATLARRTGIRYDFALGSGGEMDPTTTLADLHRLEAAAPGSIAAIEGPNEINNIFFTRAWRVTYAGQQTDICNHDLSPVALGQAALYRALRADPAFRRVPVYNYSLVGLKVPVPVNGCTTDLDADLASAGPVKGKADFGNVHSYPYRGAPPRAALAKALRQVQPAQGNHVVITETGYATSDTGKGTYLAVSENVQARYTLDALFDTYTLGHDGPDAPQVVRTYLYELLDDAPDTPTTDRERHFGLFRADGSPKPVATALHNLIAILRHPDKTRVNPRPVSFNLSQSSWREDMDANLHQLRLTAPGGGYFAVFWAEPPIWDPDARRDVPAPVNHVTLQLSRAAGVALFDPLRGTAALEAHDSARSLSFDLTDHPVIVYLH